MEVQTPPDLGTIVLFTLGMGKENILICEGEVTFSCPGDTITVTEPETFFDSNSLTQLRVVRIEDDIEEDGYYVDASIFGL